PQSIRKPLTDLDGVPSFNDIFEQLQSLTLAVYTPLAYVFPSRRSKYEVDTGTGKNTDNFLPGKGQFGREQGLTKLMTVNLLKRLEKSGEAFRLPAQEIQGSASTTLARISAHAGNLAEMVPNLDDIDFDLDDEDDANIEALSYGEKLKIGLEDIDIESWQRDLW